MIFRKYLTDLPGLSLMSSPRGTLLVRRCSLGLMWRNCIAWRGYNLFCLLPRGSFFTALWILRPRASQPSFILEPPSISEPPFSLPIAQLQPCHRSMAWRSVPLYCHVIGGGGPQRFINGRMVTLFAKLPNFVHTQSCECLTVWSFLCAAKALLSGF